MTTMNVVGGLLVERAEKVLKRKRKSRKHSSLAVVDQLHQLSGCI